ncbi:MAG TPA: ABC transporter permease [Acidobacteriaceae bacterium]|nr:ABC transporter permease [Acidobacteriaceae bacterium]
MGFVTRIRNLFRRDAVCAEIAAELRAHLSMSVDEMMRDGMSEQEARRAARLRFGNPANVRETTLGADAALALDGFWRDLRHALRQLRESPVFTVTAVVTLALGIGATTAIFTLVEQVMLRSLPVAKPPELWRVGDAADCCYSAQYAQGDWNLFSWEAYQVFRDHTPAFRDLAAFEIGEGNAELAVRRSGSPMAAETRDGEYVSGNFFRTFGVSASRGRLFSDPDDQQGAAPVAVMSFHTWQNKYGSDPSVVGATYQINGHSFTVVGVGPPGFFGAKIDAGNMPDFWLPLATEPLIAGATSRLKDPRTAWLDLIGRVQPGTNVKMLEAQMQSELHAWLASHEADMQPEEMAQLSQQTLHLSPGGSGVSLMRENFTGGLRLLLAAAICVLLVACANIANLLLARGLRNRRQTAVRAALGASRARLARKALAESLTLSVLGGGAGIAVAYLGARLVLHLAFAQNAWLPVTAAPSMPVLLFALGVAIATGVVFGIAPAWMTSQAEPIEALRGANRTIAGPSGGGLGGFAGMAGAQKMLVVLQAAVSLVLLSAAAMLGQSLRNLERQNYGFDPAGRYLVSIDPTISGVPQSQLTPLFREIEARLGALPGVREVGSVLEAPPGGWITHEIRFGGQPGPGARDDFSSGWTRVTPGFFRTFGDRIVMGRPITVSDDASTGPVAVVNEAFAKKFFGKESPIGEHFGPTPEKNAGMYEIVGVASNVEFENDLEQPMYFLPEAQSTQFDDAETERREVWSHYLYNIVLWAPGDHPDLPVQVKRVLADVDPNLVMYDVEPYPAVIREGFAQQNMIASLTWLFGAVALVLAAVGLYGVTAYGVEQRTSEIGVRIALGADRGSVVGLVLRGAFGQVLAGLALGIPAAIGAGHLIASRLYGVRPWEPRMLAGATLLLGLAALLAAAIPARRAAKVDPMQALRSE